MFGPYLKTCDVLLDAWAAGFTRQHFWITFNLRGEVILEDISQDVICVAYNDEKPPGRNQFTWILFDRYKNIKFTLNEGKKNELIFKVKRRENRESCRAQYEAHRDAYLDAASSRRSGRGSRHSLREPASPHSDPAKSVQYEVWGFSASALGIDRSKT